MEKEIESTVELGVSLTVLAVIIGMIFFTVSLGGSIRENSHAFAVETVDTVENSTLQELADEGEIIMPAATAYGIIRRYSNSIYAYHCDYCASHDIITPDKLINLSQTSSCCLATHLKGKVKLCVFQNGTGQYQVYIHSYKCTSGNTSTCICENYNHSTDCPQANKKGYCTCYTIPHGDDCPCSKRGLYDCECWETDSTKRIYYWGD